MILQGSFVFLWTNMLCVWQLQFYRCSIWILLIILTTEYEKWFNESIMVIGSYNFNRWWRPWVPQNLITSDVWSQITTWNLLFLRILISFNNYAVAWVWFCQNVPLFFFLIKNCILLFSYDLIFYFHLGCPWGHQDKLCWISYQTHILWVS